MLTSQTLVLMTHRCVLLVGAVLTEVKIELVMESLVEADRGTEAPAAVVDLVAEAMAAVATRTGAMRMAEKAKRKGTTQIIPKEKVKEKAKENNSGGMRGFQMQKGGREPRQYHSTFSIHGLRQGQSWSYFSV